MTSAAARRRAIESLRRRAQQLGPTSCRDCSYATPPNPVEPPDTIGHALERTYAENA